MSVQLQSSLFRRRDAADAAVTSSSTHSSTSTPFVQQQQQQQTQQQQPPLLSSTRHTDATALPQLRSRVAATTVPSVMEQRERENEALMQALLMDVRKAKTGFVQLGEETRRHNALLDNLERAFVGVRGSLAATMRSLDRIGVGSFAHMWLLFVFVFVFFVLVYLTLKLRG